MNKKSRIHLVAVLAGVCTLFSCKPPGDPTGGGSDVSESESKEETKTIRQKKLPADGVIESVADLKVELAEVAQGKDKSRVIESVLTHSRRLDDSAEEWDGTSASLASRFSDLSPSGNPSDEFFDKFGLAGHASNQKPTVEVEVLVRSIGALASTRPDLLQELLVRKSNDATQAESDLVVYAASLESVMEYSGLFRRIGYDGIASLRESENPVYRLLAAKLMPVLEQDLHSLAEFYRPYVAEEDETILLAAVDGLTTAGTSKAVEMLQEIAATERKDSSNVTASAKRAVELVAARHPE